MELLSVPFTRSFWTPGYDAMVTMRGVVRTEPEGLVLEYRRSERDFTTTRSADGEIVTIHIPWAEVQSLTFRQKLLSGAMLVLRTRGLRALEGVPSAEGSELVLPVARGERFPARELAANVELALAEDRLAALDAPASRGTLPPA